MKKKQRFLFPLLMAIVMMAFSPMKSWAHYVEVTHADERTDEYQLTQNEDEFSVVINLAVGEKITFYIDDMMPIACNPESNQSLTSAGLLGINMNFNGRASLTVAEAGEYLLRFEGVTADVTNDIDDEGMSTSMNVNAGEAQLTIVPVPTFASLAELKAAGQSYSAVNVYIDDEVLIAMPFPGVQGAYFVGLKNSQVALIAPTPDPALDWLAGGRVTGTLTNVKWKKTDNQLSSDDAAFWSALNYTEPNPENIPTYSSIADLLADEDLTNGTTVTITVEGTIQESEYDDGIYQITLDNGLAIASMGVTSNPGWLAGGTISGTLVNVTFMRGEGEGGEEVVGVISMTKNIFAPGAGLEYTAPVASVTIGETTTNYSDFNEALRYAYDDEPATLTLLQDINRENSMDFNSGSNVTLDLNGHSITGNLSGSLIYIVNGGTLTITDMSSEKSGYVINNGDGRAINTEDGSTLYIQAGTFCSHNFYAISIFSNNVALSGGRFITENGSRAIDINTGSVLADGYFFLDSNGDKLNEIYNIKDVTVGKVYAASVTTTNGTVQYEDLGSALSAAKAASSATVTLRQNVSLPTNTGLTFDEGNIILDLNGKSLSSSQTNAINVNGGTLTITDNSSKKSGQVSTSYGTPVSATSGSLTIHAGTFTSNVHSALIVNGGNGNLTASLYGGRFVYNGYVPIGAVSVTGISALAVGYAYYKTGSITQLSDVTSGQIYMDQSGYITDVTVDVVGRTYEDLYTVIGDLNDGDNSINISAVDGYVDGNPSHYNIYRITAPTDGKITVTIPGNGEDWIAAYLFDANFNSLTNDDYYGDFSVDCQATEGSVYYFGVRKYDGSEMGNYTITVNLPKNIDEMTLEDGIAYEGEDAGRKVLSFTYQRTFTESQVGKWQAFYVPFQMPIDKLTEAGIDVACINNFHEYTDENGNVLDRELEIKMLTSGTLKENWPYLIRPKTADEKNIVLENVKLADDATFAYGAYAYCSSVTTGYYFYGTYQPMTNLYSDGYMFLSGGTLQTAANDEQILKPQRWYLYIEEEYKDQLAHDDSGNGGGGLVGPVVEAKSINIRVIGEDDANGVEEIRVVSTKVAKNSSAGIYDIQGRKVSAPVKGINIIRQEDGSVRKVMVK